MSVAVARNYLRASRQLRDAIAVNRWDSDFVATGRPILYLFDTNVVEAYLRADSAFLGGAFGSGELFTPEAAAISSRLTLKYLFSGALPGQTHPAYLSQYHWNEVLGRADAIAHERKQPVAGQQPRSEDLIRALQVLQQHRDSPKALLDLAESLDLGATFVTIAKAASANARLKTLFIGGGKGRPDPAVRDISYSDLWDAASNAIRAEDVRFWTAELQQRRIKLDARRHAQRQQRRGDEPKSRNVHHDAMTLASLQAMHRENPDVGGSEPALRVVFISADSAIEAALHENRGRLGREGISNFLRHPRVYMPLLNFSSMHRSLPENTPEHLEVRHVFNEVEQAVKALFPFGQDETTASRYATHWRVMENIEKWSAAAEKLILVNGQYLTMEATENEAVLRDITDLLQAPDVLAATAKMLTTTLFGIRGQHAEEMAVLALRRLTSARDRVRGVSGRDYTPRAPLKLIGVDYLTPVRGPGRSNLGDLRRLEELLSAIRDEPQGENGVLNQVVTALSEAWNDPAQRAACRLLASSIYFGVGAWDSARLCADLCLGTLKGSDRWGPWAREARYCTALALRMTMNSRSEVEEASKILSENIANFAPSLATPRDRVERAALMLSATVAEIIENSYPETARQLGAKIDFIDPHRIKFEFDLHMLEMNRALAEVEGYEASEPFLAGRIRVHATINLFGGAIFAHLIDDLSEDRYPLTAVTEAAARVQADLKEFELGEGPFAAQLYLRMADFLQDPQPSKAARHIDYLRGLGSSPGEVSWADTVERSFLMRQLQTGLLASKGGPPVAG